MKIKRLLFLLLLSAAALPALAQDGGVKGRVVSREDRVSLGNVKVAIESLGLTATTDAQGRFQFDGLPAGEYRLTLEAAEFEPYEMTVRVDKLVKDINIVSLVPYTLAEIDDAVFAEFDSDIASDAQALPTSLSSSKDVYNNIASYKFSEMRFNVRGYDSQYSDIYLNGIRFNDALTGYGPWSLWSGLNDATRNQENTAGLRSSDFGIDGIGGTTNINARASQLRKGFRASVVNGNSMYRFRAMVSYASGQLDNGWSYGFSFSTRQGGNSYVDGVYYNAYGYFASVEKVLCNHRFALSVLGAPTERGAQQASTQEVYDLLGNNYYNPNVGRQNGKLRNTRVRDYHEPVVTLNYAFEISDRTKLQAAAGVRFGKNGYSSLSWMYGDDPRPDYYRYLPSYYIDRVYDVANGLPDETGSDTYYAKAREALDQWLNDPDKGMIDFDGMYRQNYLRAMEGKPSNYYIEERHTDQVDFNFTAQLAHTFRDQSSLRLGVAARANRTEYYDKMKDLLGGKYLLDIDKFAERDLSSNEMNYQNDLLGYLANGGQTPEVRKGDKFNYDYYAYVRQGQLWMSYSKAVGGFAMSLGGEVGFSNMWRQGLRMKGLFPYSSYGDSKKLNYLTYKVKGEFSYRISGAHSFEANVTYMQNAPYFNNAFVSARTRNDVTPNLTTEKVFGAELSYNLNLSWIKARVSGYYTTIEDQSKVISFYDDTYSSFTNFAMSGIDKRHYGVEVGFTAPLVADISLNGALNWGDYRYTSNPDFVQTVDNSTTVINVDQVLWKNFRVESSPQLAVNVGLSYRGPHNWFASVDFNYYDYNYLSMNPARRTETTYQSILRADAEAQLPSQMKADALNAIRSQERLDAAYTLNASIGKTWYIHRIYQLGFSLEVKNLLNNQSIRTGGYEQMRLSRQTYVDRDSQSIQYYKPFASKYFYLLGTNYYLNLYFRF